MSVRIVQFPYSFTIKSKLITSALVTAIIIFSTVGISLYGLNSIEKRYEKADDANRLIKYVQSISIEEVEENRVSPKPRFNNINTLITTVYQQLNQIKEKFQTKQNDALVDDIFFSVKEYEALFKKYERIYTDVVLQKNKMKRSAQEAEYILSRFRQQQKNQVRAVLTTGKSNILEELREADAANRMIKYLLDARRDEKNYQLYNKTSYLNSVLNNINGIEDIATKMRAESEKQASKMMAIKVLKELSEYKAAYKTYLSGKKEQSSIWSTMVSKKRLLEDNIFRLRQDQKVEIKEDVSSAYTLLFSGAGSAIFIVIIIALLVIKYVLTPIKSITTAMNDIADSDSVMEVKLDVKGNDEISELTKAFNRFAKKITVAINRVSEMSLKLAHSQKMEALGQLTGGIAHDFNNMLGVILGYSGLLRDALYKEPVLLGYVDNISKAGERNAELTQKLLRFSKNNNQAFKEGECQYVDINNNLISMNEILKKALTPEVKLKYKLQNNLSKVCVNEGDFEDGILNLVINAVHAMSRGGSIIIETKDININRQINVTLDIPVGNYVYLSVQDTGSGIPAEIRDKIFDPFFTTKKELGTGLGLSQLYGFVQRSKAYIDVNSNEKEGTRFDIYFPIVTEEITENVIDSKKGIEYQTEKAGCERVLIVDDSPDLLEFNRLVLAKHGYNVCAVESGEAALHELEEHKFDLLLSDIIMPNMAGYELAIIVQENYPEIKIILMSGYSESRNLADLDIKQVDGILKKPFKQTELLSSVRAALDSSIN